MGVAYFLVLGGVEARAPGPHWYKTPLPAPTRSG